MNLVLDDMDEKVKQRFVLPSAWSEMRIRVRFDPMPSSIPNITALNFTGTVSSLSVRDKQTVLHISSNIPGASILCDEISEEPFSELYHVVKERNKKVELKLSDNRYGKLRFDRWVIRAGSSKREATEETLSVLLDRHTKVDCYFKAPSE